VLFFFVDGLGLGPLDPAVNPLAGRHCPTLRRLLARARPIDAQLGVPGLPQSATGQTAIFTGVNAPALVGAHVEGYPTQALREVIHEHNLYRRLRARGRRCTFANAYFTDDLEQVRAARRQSVTTVAALSGCGRVRGRGHLLRNQAVYHDLTRERLVPRGYDGALITPEAAARHLAAIARRHDLTVFEFFVTDHAGHAGCRPTAEAVLERLDRCLAALLPRLATAGVTFVLSSDHGNIEDLSVRTHTRNPAPLVAVGPGAAGLRRRVAALTDIAGALEAFLAPRRRPPKGTRP
jgi:hypothetical protein